LLFDVWLETHRNTARKRAAPLETGLRAGDNLLVGVCRRFSMLAVGVFAYFVLVKQVVPLEL
jgi:hypothetical protein